MIRVNMLQDVELVYVEDKMGVSRQLKIFIKDGNMYIGTVQTLFDRNFIMKDRHRMDFNSKLDNHQNELVHVSVILSKIDKYPQYSYFDKEGIIKLAKSRGITDLSIKKKSFTAAKELFIEFGFNSMNFCLDRRGDIWVHYKLYEEQKQRRSIMKHVDESLQAEFDAMYRRNFRFVRYVSIDEETGEVKCFALKSLNITKIYEWLSDHMLIHSIEYVSEIYNETLRELQFHKGDDEDDMYYKVISDENGVRLKTKPENKVPQYFAI